MIKGRRSNNENIKDKEALESYPFLDNNFLSNNFQSTILAKAHITDIYFRHYRAIIELLSVQLSLSIKRLIIA